MNARIARAVLLSMFLILGVPGIAATQDAATTPGSVTSSPYVTVSGQTIAWIAPWTFVEDDAMQTSDLDLVFLTDGSATVAVSTGDIFPENARGLVIGFLGGDTDLLEVLDAGAGATTSYWFDQFLVDDVPFGAFSIATTLGAGSSVLVMYISPVASFGEGMASAQAAITLDGEPVFANVDGMALQAQLPTAAPTPDPSGFKPEDQWIDEAYGVTVEWAGGWSSFGIRNVNTFMLGSYMPMATVNITAMDGNGAPPEYWASELKSRPLEVTPGAVVFEPYVGPSNVIGGVFVDGMLMIQEVLFLEDGQTVVLVTLGTLPELAPQAVNAFRADVRINGRTLLDGWENVAPQIEGLSTTASVESQPAGTTLPSEGTYESPQFGVVIEWDTDSWALCDDNGDPTSSMTDERVDALHLEWAEEQGVWVDVFVAPSYGSSLAGIVAYSESPGVVESIFGPDVQLLQTAVEGDSAVMIYRGTTPFEPMLIYQSYTLVNGGETVVMVVYMAYARQVEDGLASAQQDLTVEGQPALSFYTIEQVVEIFGR